MFLQSDIVKHFFQRIFINFIESSSVKFYTKTQANNYKKRVSQRLLDQELMSFLVFPFFFFIKPIFLRNIIKRNTDPLRMPSKGTIASNNRGGALDRGSSRYRRHTVSI